MQLFRYLTLSGKDVLGEWLAEFRDLKTRARIVARLDRLAADNFCDCRPVGEGVWELRIDFGPGYRVYYAIAGKTAILLLCGGDKRRQASDIRHAIAYWKDYQRRTSKQ